MQFHPEKSGDIGSEGSGRIFADLLMLTKRIIACLDVNAGRVVKGVQFEQLRDAGDPAELGFRAQPRRSRRGGAARYLCYAREPRNLWPIQFARTAQQLFVPFTVGGGIRSLEDAMAVFEAGADKVSINSAALADSYSDHSDCRTIRFTSCNRRHRRQDA